MPDRAKESRTLRVLETARDATSSTHDLPDALAARTAPAVLFENVPGHGVRCTACAHRCVVAEGRHGTCGVRFVRDGVLRAPHGYVARRYVRAIETNTLFHVHPGANALTFGMYGCDLRCPYCHNWKLSQALRDDVANERPEDIAPADLVREAIAADCRAVCAAYNEPMIAAEWVRSVFAEARAHGLATAVISDGNTTPEALAYLRPVTDVFRVDWKAETPEQYRALGGRPGPVIDAIREARRLGYWVEVVTLVVPGFNDDLDALRRMARVLADIDADIPWHLNAFVPRYRLASAPRMAGYPLIAAAGTAYARGLRYVYVSNLADEVRELSHTRCARCHTTLIERFDYRTTSVALRDGQCPNCGDAAPGLWGTPRPSDLVASSCDGEMP